MRMTNYMKMLLLPVLALILFSCTVEEPDYREKDYGYVQFKLYKEASYAPLSKASGDELTYLSDATKVKVEFTDGVNMLSQTLVLNAYDEAYAEFGLRSDKIKLLAGTYEIRLADDVEFETIFCPIHSSLRPVKVTPRPLPLYPSSTS